MGRIDAKLPSDVFVHRGRPASPAPAPLREPTASRPSRSITGLLKPGAILDKYRIEEVIGTGGFGAVYRATHLVLRMTVAIKHLRREIVAERPGIVAHLVEEARWAARIQHPSVVRVFDVTEHPSLTYVVMEFIDGAPLSRVIDARGRLGATEVAALGIDVAEGLEAGLVQGLIHRDIKPANILVAKGGRARIVDLGLACAAAASARLSSARPSSVVGTRG
jgi:serine/threonine protein kinase